MVHHLVKLLFMRSFPIAAKPFNFCLFFSSCANSSVETTWVPLQTTGSALSQNPKTLSETTSVAREHALFMLLLTMSTGLMDEKEGDQTLENLAKLCVFLSSFLMILLRMSTFLMDEK